MTRKAKIKRLGINTIQITIQKILLKNIANNFLKSLKKTQNGYLIMSNKTTTTFSFDSPKDIPIDPIEMGFFRESVTQREPD
jgi:hypothetical protein